MISCQVPVIDRFIPKHVDVEKKISLTEGIFISVINQLDAQNFCFTISLFHASTCFKHMCSSSGGQICITQPLVSSHLYMFRAHVLIMRRSNLHYTASGIITPIGVMIPEAV